MKKLLLTLALLLTPLTSYGALTDNVLSAWNFDESSGNPTDSTGNYSLTNTNTTYTTAKINNGAVLNGTSSVLAGPKNSYFKMQTAMTYVGWIKPGADIANNSIIGAFDTTTNQEGPWFFTNASGQLCLRIAAAGVTNLCSTGVDLNPGTWYFVALVVKSGSVYLYVNTNQVGSTPYNSLTTVDLSFTFGTRTGSAQYGNHTLDAFNVYNRAITDAEMTSLYNSGNGLQYPFPTGGGYFSSDYIWFE